MKRLVFLFAALALFWPHGAQAQTPTVNGAAQYCKGAASCPMTVTTVAASDIIKCYGVAMYSGAATCSAPGCKVSVISAESIAQTASQTNSVVQIDLSGCPVGSNTLTVSGGNPVTGAAIVITGSPSLDGSGIIQPASVNAGAMLAGPQISTSQNDYCPAYAADMSGNGGAAQKPQTPFVSEGVPNKVFPEDLADYVQTVKGTITPSFAFQTATSEAVIAASCYKGPNTPPPPVTISFRICTATQCMDLPTGANTITLYMVSNGSQSAPLATDSFSILPTPNQ